MTSGSWRIKRKIGGLRFIELYSECVREVSRNWMGGMLSRPIQDFGAGIQMLTGRESMAPCELHLVFDMMRFER